MKPSHIMLAIGIFLLFSSFYPYDKKVTIYLKEYDCSFTPQKDACSDTITKTLDDGRNLRIILYDCKGKMHLECFKNNKKLEEGDYINSLDLLKKYITRVDGIKGNQKIKVYEFYQPLRSGTWSFYNLKGELLRIEMYKDGILQK